MRQRRLDLPHTIGQVVTINQIDRRILRIARAHWRNRFLCRVNFRFAPQNDLSTVISAKARFVEKQVLISQP
jgi:hypothetical protein